METARILANASLCCMYASNGRNRKLILAKLIMRGDKLLLCGFK